MVHEAPIELSIWNHPWAKQGLIFASRTYLTDLMEAHVRSLSQCTQRLAFFELMTLACIHSRYCPLLCSLHEMDDHEVGKISQEHPKKKRSPSNAIARSPKNDLSQPPFFPTLLRSSTNVQDIQVATFATIYSPSIHLLNSPSSASSDSTCHPTWFPFRTCMCGS